jgi:hypothetical protein
MKPKFISQMNFGVNVIKCPLSTDSSYPMVNKDHPGIKIVIENTYCPGKF